jgi:hypothetical protein
VLYDRRVSLHLEEPWAALNDDDLIALVVVARPLT